MAACLLFSLLFFTSVNAESEETVRVLPSITVYPAKKTENTTDQKRGAVWDVSSDSTITKEKDGAYTARDTTNPYSLRLLIASEGNPKVNFDISYARNSASMTADGRALVSTLIDAIGHLQPGTIIGLTPINTPDQEGSSITKRRFNSLRESLLQVKGVEIKFMPSKVQGSRSKLSNKWRIQIQRKV